MKELGRLIEELEFTILPVVIKKQELKNQYAKPCNSYELTLTFCMEKTYSFLRKQYQIKKLSHIVI